MNADLSLINERLLPTQVRIIARVIGLPDTLNLLKARGGGWLKVPLNSDNSQALVGIISKQNIVNLVTAFAGKRFDLPQQDKIIQQLRNLAINEMRKTKTDTQVGREFNLSRRHIINISKNQQPANPTLDLFPIDNS